MNVVPSAKQLSAVAAELRGLVGRLDPELVTTREAVGMWGPLEEIRRLAAGSQVLLAKRVDESDAPSKAGLRNGKALRVKAAADPDPDKTRRRIRRERSLRWFLDQEGAWRLHGRGPAEAGAELATVLAPIVDDIFATAREAGLREPREAYTWDGLLEMARMAWAYLHGQALDDVHDTGTAVDDPSGDAANGDAGAATTVGDATGNDACHDDHEAVAPAGTDAVEAGDGAVAVRAPGKRRRRTAGVKPWARVIVRIDHSALLRGHVEGDEVCDVVGVGPISVAAAREVLGQANVDLVITKGRDVANYTSLGRGPDVAQRIALLWNQPECQRLGCHRPVMEWDHSTPYAYDRVTEIANLQGLCRPDHRLKSEHGWDLAEGTGKRPMVPPDDPRHPNNTGRRPRDRPDARPFDKPAAA